VTFVNTSNIVATQDQNRDYFTVGIGPNPAAGHVNVWARSPQNTDAALEIVAMDGRTLYSSPFRLSSDIRVKTISLADFPAGFYIVRIVEGDKVTARKLIVR